MQYQKNMANFDVQQKTRVTQMPGGNSSLSLAWQGSQEEPSSRQRGAQQYRARDRSQGPMQSYGRTGQYSDSLDNELNRRNSGQGAAPAQQAGAVPVFGQRVTQKTTNDYQDRSSIKLHQQQSNNIQFGDYDYFKSDPYAKRNSGGASQAQAQAPYGANVPPPAPSYGANIPPSYRQAGASANVDSGFDLGALQREYQIPIYAMEKDVRSSGGVGASGAYDSGAYDLSKPPRSPYLNAQQQQQQQQQQQPSPYTNKPPAYAMPPKPPSGAPYAQGAPQARPAPLPPSGANNNHRGVNHPVEGFSNGYRVNQPPGGRSQISFG